MIAAHPGLAYVSEPLNVWHRPGVMSASVKKWYTYIHSGNESEYLPSLRATLAFRYGLGPELRSLRTFRDFFRMGRDLSGFLRARLLGLAPVIKDPFAIFSAAWFAQRLGCRIVITTRHPAGFASSLKWLDWRFNFQDLLDQPVLMDDWLEPDRREMEAMPDDDVIRQAALLWRMVYRVVSQFQHNDPQFIVVRHEDLSVEPLDGFKSLYERLGLSFHSRTAEAVLRSSQAGNPRALSKKNVHSVKLDSRSNLMNWKQRLTGAEIETIRAITAEVARDYYPESDWKQ